VTCAERAVVDEAALLERYPGELCVAADDVAAARRTSGRTLIVLDDDPTGTQSVADLPVLTRWAPDDLAWALQLRPAAVYVQTNTRSLSPVEAAVRTREVVTNALAAAAGEPIEFVSRSDSTLRGHFPLETDTIAGVLEDDGATVDGVVVVPAFPDAGRVTVGGVHYVRQSSGDLVPVAQTEFAQDRSFGFTRSRLAAWVAEKSAGRYREADVVSIGLEHVRGGPDAVAERLASAAGRAPVVVDAVTESDLRVLALGIEVALAQGMTFVHRVGPPFVRARIGQHVRPPLTRDDVFGVDADRAGGFVVVGSHVALTTRQLQHLVAHRPVHVVEMDVRHVLEPGARAGALDRAADDVLQHVPARDVVLHTSRELVAGRHSDESLAVAGLVSSALVEVVRRVVASARPRFVVAKGGITSSDVATEGLGIARAFVRGPLLPGLVSLWQATSGPAEALPYVVFAGNVGDDTSLTRVVELLSAVEPDAVSLGSDVRAGARAPVGAP
jgi:uncharacterized protein YgbK (DUF1537 family)